MERSLVNLRNNSFVTFSPRSRRRSWRLDRAGCRSLGLPAGVDERLQGVCGQRSFHTERRSGAASRGLQQCEKRQKQPCWQVQESVTVVF